MILIDTPGFDDTNHTDIEILEIIGLHLKEGSQKKKFLTGLIYMQRITDNRVPGSARRSLRILQKMCGNDNFAHLALVTSQWDVIAKPDGVKREEELRNGKNFWAEMIEHGAEVCRHSNSPESAIEILKTFLPKLPIVLQFQKEFEEHGIIGKTAAGQEVVNSLFKELTICQGLISELTATKETLENDIIRLRAQMNRDKEERDTERERVRNREKQIRKELLLKERDIKVSKMEKEKMNAEMQYLKEEVEKLKLARENPISDDLRLKERRLERAEGEVQELKGQIKKLQQDKEREKVTKHALKSKGQAVGEGKTEQDKADGEMQALEKEKEKESAVNEDWKSKEQTVKEQEIAKESEITRLKAEIAKLKQDMAAIENFESKEQAIEQVELAEEEAERDARQLRKQLETLQQKEKEREEDFELKEQLRNEKETAKDKGMQKIEEEMNEAEQKKHMATNGISMLEEPASKKRFKILDCIVQ